MWFDAVILMVAVIAGAIAAVTGFGIGSLLTPMLAVQIDTRLAVAAVSIPHAIGTAIRFWLLRRGVDRRVLWNFGLTSAAGGLIGATLNSWASNRWLSVVFGVLLLFCGGKPSHWPRPTYAFSGLGRVGRGSALRAVRRVGRQSGRYPIRCAFGV
jgi:uncharacterized membrane protein YfcA